MTDTAIPPIIAAGEEVKGRSLWVDAWRRLRRNRAAVASIVILALVAFASVVAPLLSPFSYDDVFWDSVNVPPDFASGHYFGTDDNGYHPVALFNRGEPQIVL